MSWYGRGAKGEKIKRTTTDKNFSDYVRERDDWTCQKCDKKFTQGKNSKKLHCAHIWFGRADITTRWEPLNCISLCIGCHIKNDQSPAEAWELLTKHRTPEEIMWLQQQRDEVVTIKIPKEEELKHRKIVKQLMKDLKEEKANGKST